MTCCQQRIYALGLYYNFVSVIAARDMCFMSHPPAPRFPVSLHYGAQ